MQTLNISLPKQLARKVDQIVNEEGYASRSEFVRALLRFYLAANIKEELRLLPFNKVSLQEIETNLVGSGKYNQKFIKSVVSGLGKSSVYAKG